MDDSNEVNPGTRSVKVGNNLYLNRNKRKPSARLSRTIRTKVSPSSDKTLKPGCVDACYPSAIRYVKPAPTQPAGISSFPVPSSILELYLFFLHECNPTVRSRLIIGILRER